MTNSPRSESRRIAAFKLLQSKTEDQQNNTFMVKRISKNKQLTVRQTQIINNLMFGETHKSFFNQ